MAQLFIDDLCKCSKCSSMKFTSKESYGLRKSSDDRVNLLFKVQPTIEISCAKCGEMLLQASSENETSITK